MADGPDNALVEDVARSLVAEFAPDELMIFSVYSEQFFRDPEPLFRKQKASDEMLGFGAAEALVMTTPFALTAAQAVVGFVWGVMKKGLEDQGAAAFSTWLRG